MQIAGVKAVHDVPVGLVQHRGLSPHGPITHKGPLVEPQPGRGSVDSRLIQYGTTGGRKVLGALIADIVFARSQVVPIGSSFSTTGIDRNQFIIYAADSCLG